MQDPFEQAEIAHYSESERRQYFESQKEYWDNYSIMTTALNKGLRQGRAEGRAEGLAEGRVEGLAEGRVEGLAEGEAKANRENARRMKAKGYAIHDIAEVTGLSEEEIACTMFLAPCVPSQGDRCFGIPRRLSPRLH